jgi:hypothetical protein
VRDGPAPELAADTRGITEDSGEDWISRYVTVNGVSSVANQAFGVGKHRAGHVVDIRIAPRSWRSGTGPSWSKTVMRTSKGVVRKKKAEKN